MKATTLELRRYIKDYETANVLKHYCNNNFLFLLNTTADSLGYRNGEQREYDKLKKAICRYINENFGIYNVSKKQISRLIQPKKNRVSKYAPLYIIAMYNMLLQAWPDTMHVDICCRKQYNAIYSEFALDRFISMKERCSWNNPGDELIEVFDHYLGVVNRHMPGVLGIEFSNDHPKTRFNKEEIV